MIPDTILADLKAIFDSKEALAKSAGELTALTAQLADVGGKVSTAQAAQAASQTAYQKQIADFEAKLTDATNV